MAEPSHRRRSSIRRLPALAALAAALAVGLLAGGATSAQPPAVPPAATGPAAAPAAALSSSWFCAGATDVAKGAANATLVLTDAGRRLLHADVRIVSSTGAATAVRLAVGAGAQATVPEGVPGGAPWVGASVTFDGGQASVEQVVTGPSGAAVEPCATAGSSSWYFAGGETLLNADTTITLLNPYPAPAIVNLSFTTDLAQESPGAFQGLVVPPHGLLAVPLRAHLRRRQLIATTVQASAGQVVAWKTDVVTTPPKGAPITGTKAASAPLADPASPYVSVTTLLGAPEASTSWVWPDGETAAGTDETYEVYNPGALTAKVSLGVDLDQGSAEPFTLTVGPQAVVTFTTSASVRVPAGVPYAASLRSTNGVPVVAERVVTEAAPSPGRGTTEMLGATRAARSWLVGATRAGGDRDRVLTVADPSAAAATVSVAELVGGRRVALAGLAAVRLSGRAPLVVDLSRLGAPGAAPLIVTSTRPVVVSRELLASGLPGGVTTCLGVPLG